MNRHMGYSILQSFLGLKNEAYSYRVSLIAIKIYTAYFAYRRMYCGSFAWRLCLYFYNKGRTNVTKSRKNVKFVIL